LYDDLLGNATTDEHGQFDIVSESSDFQEFFEESPEVYLKVYASDRETLLYKSEDSVRIDAGGPSSKFDVRVPHDDLGDYAPQKRIRFLGEDGQLREEYDVGESLAIEIDGLPPGEAAEINIRVDGQHHFTSRFPADENGHIPETVVWPQMGLESDEGEPLTVDEARQEWVGRKIGVTIQANGETVSERSFTFPEEFGRPLILSVDEEGRIANGFEIGTADASIQGQNISFDGEGRVYMVESQGDWQVGDKFTPVTLADGSQAVTEIEVEDGELTATVAPADALDIGRYDFIVRNVRYGYEDEDDFTLREEDHVTRTVTGLVVRHRLEDSKPILGSCTNKQPISGRKLSTSPYFEYGNTFQKDEDVWAALDPNGIDPSLYGKMAAFYVVKNKTQSGWSSNPSLNHISELGGNPNVIVTKVQSQCINKNAFKLWPNANTGEYDIVADFGNNGTFDMPDDIIDGYIGPGFRVINDPTTDTSFSNRGEHSYDRGSVTVKDQRGMKETVRKKSVVRFPADAAGKKNPSQISSRQSSYPVVLVAHGNSPRRDSYKGYDYLLDHLAKNGFIAASYHMNPGMGYLDRAKVAFAHLNELKNDFGANMANNVGIFGHSRGGEAAAIVPRLNHQQHGQRWNINAAVSLAPTDATGETLKGRWATPYLVLYGSLDGDVAGGYRGRTKMSTGFAIHDRASGEEKSMIFIYRASHGRFNTVWGDYDLQLRTIGPGEKAKALPMSAHKKILQGYATGFFRQHLKGETKFRGAFAGEWTPAAIDRAAGGSVELYSQYQSTTHEVIDNFEGSHPTPDWKTSTIGGTVDDNNTLPSDPTEDELYNVDPHSPHDTAGLLLEWDSTSDNLRFTVPAPNRNVKKYKALSFRVTQKVGSSVNPSGEQDLYVTLEDGNGTVRKAKASSFGTIPKPFQRYYNRFTKSAMNTIRVPLDAFVIKVPGPGPIDLTDVREVRFEFEREPTGEIEIDSVEFTN
jgi:hypothetical protein